MRTINRSVDRYISPTVTAINEDESVNYEATAALKRTIGNVTHVSESKVRAIFDDEQGEIHR